MIKDTILNISKKLLNLDSNFIPTGTVINVAGFGNIQNAKLTKAGYIMITDE